MSGQGGNILISAEVMLKSGRVAHVKFLEAMLSVSSSSSIVFNGSIFMNIVFEDAVGIVYLMLVCELPNARNGLIVVSSINMPPDDGLPSKNWTNILSACAGPVFFTFAVIVIVSPAVGVGFEKVMSA